MLISSYRLKNKVTLILKIKTMEKMIKQNCMQELTIQEAGDIEGGGVLAIMAISYCAGLAVGIGIRLYAAS